MESTGGDASWLKGKNVRHNGIIHNMVRAGLLDRNKHAKKWCSTAETSEEVYGCKIHIELENTSPHFEWYVQKPITH